MAYNKTSEERKWNYWKEQEEKKLRELGMEEEKIQKLRQMDREDFLEERRYREHLDEMMQDMDSIKQRDRGRFAQDIRELLDNIGDRRIYELLKGTEHQTLEILLLSTWGYSIKEIANIMGLPKDTVYTKRKIFEYSCAMKSHFRKFGNQMSGSGNHLCNYASLLA